MAKDLYGQALLDYFNGEYTEDIITTSDITEEDEMPLPYMFRAWKDMPQLEKEALNLASGKILDVGAGSGSHTLALQDMGKDVTALDISAGAIEVCQKRGVKQAIMEDVMQHNEQYDTILLLMNGAGLPGRVELMPQFLAHVKSILKPGGQILTDSSDIKYMFEDEEGGYWLDLNKEYYGDLTFQMHYKGESTDDFPWLYIDFEKLAEIANQVGLKAEKLLDGPHYDYLAKLY